MGRRKKEVHLCCKCKGDFEELWCVGEYGRNKFGDSSKEFCEDCFEKELIRLEKLYKKWEKEQLKD